MKKMTISIGNSMICSDIWHKYHEWYFEFVIRNLRQFWNITSGIYAHYHVQIILLFVYTTARKGFVMFTCGNFKLSWNTTGISQSNWRNFSCSIKLEIRVLQNFPKLEEKDPTERKKGEKSQERKRQKRHSTESIAWPKKTAILLHHRNLHSSKSVFVLTHLPIEV